MSEPTMEDRCAALAAAVRMAIQPGEDPREYVKGIARQLGYATGDVFNAAAVMKLSLYRNLVDQAQDPSIVRGALGMAAHDLRGDSIPAPQQSEIAAVLSQLGRDGLGNTQIEHTEGFRNYYQRVMIEKGIILVKPKAAEPTLLGPGLVSQDAIREQLKQLQADAIKQSPLSFGRLS